MKNRDTIVSKRDYVKWYNIAKDTIKDENLIPARTDEEIYSIVSQKNWLPFAGKGETKEDIANKDEPNIFFDVLSEEGNLTGSGRLGLTFNNIGAYEKFKTIMKGPNKEIKDKITRQLHSLKYSWNIILERKIKKLNYASSPDYFEVKRWNSSKFDENILDELLEKANSVREQGTKNRIKEKEENGRYYSETPAIDLMTSNFRLEEEEFKDRILEIFNIYALCLDVKNDVEVNKIVRQKKKELLEKKEKLDIKKKDLPTHKKMIGVVSGITEDMIKEKEEDIKILEEEVEKLEKDIEDK